MREGRHYIVDPESGCWEWQLAKQQRGYGVAAYGRPAHRVSYELHVGPIPDGMEIDHVRARGCRSRACVNPAHLELVTRVENMRRGRSAKLTLEDARVIRASRDSGVELARQFGVGPSAIYAIRAGRNWKDAA